ncbi:hypothetical protein [Candidatus Methylacidiphilum infernorum]|uniref:hypothetical protein n=1 Tax=Candidatus Methylacidiphilum infernorum TaxID=511746 RepID=UPI00164EE2AA|nr:hypothetical protein [Candidatus Methylacidiphilum infernorum]
MAIHPAPGPEREPGPSPHRRLLAQPRRRGPALQAIRIGRAVRHRQVIPGDTGRDGQQGTLLVGHTHWHTRGRECINRNNSPIRTGDVIGIHNGTIYNADHLFRRLRLQHFVEVDNELLFRLADRAFWDKTPDLERFKHDLALCREQITAVLADEHGWRPLPLEPMTRLVFRHESLVEFSMKSLTFIAQGKRGKAP